MSFNYDNYILLNTITYYNLQHHIITYEYHDVDDHDDENHRHLHQHDHDDHGYYNHDGIRVIFCILGDI